MKLQRVSLAYAGPALDGGGMDILELAPAMGSLGRLFQRANYHANGNRATLTVEVFPMRQGSLELDLGMTIGIFTQAQAMLGTITIVDAIGIFKALFGPNGLIAILKKIGKGEAKLDGHSLVSIGNAVNTTVTVNQITINLANDPAAREAVAEVVRPLLRPGVERLERVEEHKRFPLVKKEDVPAFQPPPLEESSTEQVKEADVMIVPRTISTYVGPKWRVRFFGNDVDFHVRITDDVFLTRYVHGAEPIVPGSVLRVRMRTSTVQGTDGEPESQHSVVRVYGIDAPPPNQQTSLPPGADEQR